MSLLPLMVLGGYNLKAARENLEAAVSYHHTLATARVAGDVAGMLDEAQRALGVFADTSGPELSRLSLQERIKLLNTCLRNLPYVEELAAYNGNGQELVRESRREVITGEVHTSFVAPEAWQKLRRQQNYLGPVIIDEHNQPVFQLAVPFLPSADGRSTGVIVAQISLRSIMERISLIPAGEGGYIFIVDQEGRLIGHEDYSQVLSRQDVRASLPPPKSENQNGGEPRFRTYVSYTGEKVVGAYAPVNGTDWVVILEQPYNTAYASAEVLSHTFGMSTLIIAVMVLGTSLLFGWRFGRQLEILKTGVSRMVSGEMGFSLPIKRQDEIGEVLQAFNSLSEELHRKRNMEAAIRHADKMVTVGLLAAGVAHEINNPLATIYLSVEEVLDRLAPGRDENINSGTIEDLRSYLMTISQQAERCSAITRNLLDFAREGSGQGEEIDYFDFHETLHKALFFLEYKMRKENINMTKELAPELPLLWGDASGIQQVVFNLICNAVAAMPEGGFLHLSTMLIDQSVCFTVKDTGIGIPPENLSRIFEPFFTTKPPGQGTGLGLSVCYGLVAKAGGRIEVQSELDNGTTVTVYLPVKEKGDLS